MSLSDRLRKARTQHLIEAGVLARDPEPVDDAAPDPEIDLTTPEEAVTEDESQGLFSPITIEARPVGLHLVAEAPLDLDELAAGDDTATCPTCRATGRADMVDLVGHTVHYTCASCSTMWQVHRPVVRDSVAG
jgi:hypothetical protein